MLHSPRRLKPLKIKRLSNVWASLSDISDRGRISKVLSFDQINWYNGERRRIQISLISETGKFFAGFIPYLQERFQVELDGQSSQISINPELAHKVIKARTYQIEALAEIADRQRGIILLPTGTGKTILAAMVMASAPKARVLFIVHTKDLFKQTIEVLENLLGRTSIGYVGEGKEWWNQRTVGMIQSLRDYKFKQHPVDMVMVDEAHHVPAKSYRKLLKKTDCPVRLGFTGTIRNDDEGRLYCQGLLGSVLYDYSYREAAEDGWISHATVRMLKAPFSLEAAGSKDYPQVYEYGIVQNEDRNKLIVRETISLSSRGKSVLVQVRKIDHGYNLLKMFDGQAVFVHGEHTSEERKQAKEELKQQTEHGKIVVASSIFDEGIDIPSLGAIVIAGAGLSEIKSIQKIGRGLRRTAEKSEVIVIDFYDSCHKFLRRHSRERMKTYDRQGWTVKEEY